MLPGTSEHHVPFEPALQLRWSPAGPEVASDSCFILSRNNRTEPNSQKGRHLMRMKSVVMADHQGVHKERARVGKKPPKHSPVHSVKAGTKMWFKVLILYSWSRRR